MPAASSTYGRLSGPKIGDELRSRDRLEDVVGRHRQERVREHHDGRQASPRAGLRRAERAALKHAQSLSDAETEVNCGSAHGCPVAAVLRHPTRRRPPGSPLLFIHRRRHRVLRAGPGDPERPVHPGLRALTPWSTSRRRARWSCRSSCRPTRCSPPGSARAGHHRNAALLQPERPGPVVRLQARADAAPDGRVLRLGELLRRHRAGARVELRQLAVRHTSGEAAVRADRLRRIPRRNRRRLPGPGAGRPARRLHRTCCWYWRSSSLLATIVVTVANVRIRRRGPACASASRAPRPMQTARAIARQSLPPADSRHRIPDGDRDAVDRPPAQSRDVTILQQRRDGPHPVQRHLHPGAGHCQLPRAALRDEPGAAPVRPGGRRSSRCRCRSGLGTALIVLAAGVLAGARRPTPSIRHSGSRSTGRPTSCSTCRLRRRTACHSRTPSTSSARGSPMRSGAVVYGILTVGFWVLPGIGLDLRGTAIVNSVLIVAWLVVAWRLRAAYVQTIQESIHRHRMDTERTSSAVLERSAAEALRDKLAAGDPGEVRYALEPARGAAHPQLASRVARAPSPPRGRRPAARTCPAGGCRRPGDRRRRRSAAAGSRPRRYGPRRCCTSRGSRASIRSRRSRSSETSPTSRSARGWRRSSPRQDPRRISMPRARF